MTDKGARLIAISIIAFAAAYAICNRYAVVSSPIANAIITKDNWTGSVEICSTKECFLVR